MRPRQDHALLENMAYDFAVSNPEGFTVYALAEHLSVSVGTARAVIHRLRRTLAAGDSINLPCHSTGTRAPWVYSLAGTTEGVRSWEVNRLGDAETRLETILSVASSVKRGSDGRSKEGKKARAIELGVRQLLERLEVLEEEFESV
jgi:hypothetical protein